MQRQLEAGRTAHTAMEEANYSYGDVSVTTKTSHSKQATPEELVALANTIWKLVRESGIPASDEKRNDALLATLQNEQKDFNTSFPLVLRWMVQMRSYDARAFRKYLDKHSGADLSSREAFLELQADYLVLLYRETHGHVDEKFLTNYRRSIIDSLLAEDREFLRMREEVEAEMKVKEAAADQERRQALYEYLMRQKVKKEGAQ